ncbi:MAG: MraY family glycosyltransferase [Bacilli bacterium]|nr:MraY family glycosyltransferase [Bacilli bacterium]
MNLEICLSFIVTFFISLLLVPIVNKITKKLGIIAHTNNRTIHKGIIARTGGYAIYASFLIGAMIFLKTDIQINSIMIGGFIIFLVGFYDDIHDLKPKYKMIGQIIAALVVIFYGGISLKGFTIPFLPDTLSYIIAIIITIGWIVGITNAINLIDGLDGLCAGISIIVLFTISMTSLTYGRTDISSLSLLLAGAIAGFLVYNFHPASVFLGDCGALYIGFMISVISLLGFGYKSSTFFTLGAPIVVLMVPIVDTIIAIVRRKVHHKSFSEADRNHLHHNLMFKLELGQTKSVLTLYVVTILFSLCSYLYLYDKIAATVLFIMLMIVFEIFVEATGMIDRKYKPVLTLMNIFIKSEYLPQIRDTKSYRRFMEKRRPLFVVCSALLIALGSYGIYKMIPEQPKVVVQKQEFSYKQAKNETQLMKNIYNKLKIAFDNEKEEEVYKLVGSYFAVDYFNLTNKNIDEIGGIDYFYQDKKDNFMTYAKEDYYKDVNSLIENNTNTQEVVDYTILSYGESTIALEDLEDYSYYDVKLLIEFNEYNKILASNELEVTIHMIKKSQKYSVVSIDY